MKLPKLHKATSTCELRPVMNHVFVTKENATASNTTIVVSHKTSELFSKEFIKNIPKDGMYITSEDWKVFTTEFIAVELDNNLIITVHKKKCERLIKAKSIKKVGSYPDWKALFKQYEVKDFNCGDFGMKASNVLALQYAIGSDNLRFQCFNNTKQINIIADSCDFKGVLALIMPIMIND